MTFNRNKDYAPFYSQLMMSAAVDEFSFQAWFGTHRQLYWEEFLKSDATDSVQFFREKYADEIGHYLSDTLPNPKLKVRR